MSPFYCPRCGKLDAEGISGHASSRCHVTNAVTKSVVTRNQDELRCNHCVTKDAEIERLRNQLADAMKRADEWAKISVEVGKNERKKAKRDRAAYMRSYRGRHDNG